MKFKSPLPIFLIFVAIIAGAVISRANITSKFGSEVDPEEAISVMDAIRMHTIWAAYSGFEEKLKGSLEVGKLADMVVLSDDPLSVPAEELMSIQADVTIVDGKIAHERN